MVIVLPFVAVKEAFPDRHDSVTITLRDKTRFEGTYEVGGHFLHGRIDAPAGSRFFARVELRELGRTLILETAHQRPDPKAPQEPTLILPQVELLTDYRKALVSASLPEKRMELIKEALTFLKGESLPLVREWLADTGETDAMKADLLSFACGDDSPRVGWELSRKLGEAARQAHLGPETQAAALFCLRDSETRQLPVPSREILGQLIFGVCEVDDARVQGVAFGALYKLYAQPVPPPVQVKELIGRCDRPDRRALLATCLGTAAAREDYAAVFKTSSKAAEQTWRCLNPDEPAFVVGYEEALRAEPTLQRLSAHQSRKPLPTARELSVVAERYAQPSRVEGDLYAWRGLAIRVFHRAAQEPRLTAEARAVLREALKHPEVRKSTSPGGVAGLLNGIHRKLAKMNGADAQAGGGEDPELRAALVALGESDETLGAAAGLGPVLHRGNDHGSVSDGTTLIELALFLSGCTEDEIRDAAQASKQSPRPPPGPFCLGQKQARGAPRRP
jgi:hypothetical protein